MVEMRSYAYSPKWQIVGIDKGAKSLSKTLSPSRAQGKQGRKYNTDYQQVELMARLVLGEKAKEK